MGANRKKMSHVGLEIIPLCREHHQTAHEDSTYLRRNHLKPITVDAKMDVFIRKGTLRLYKEENDEKI